MAPSWRWIVPEEQLGRAEESPSALAAFLDRGSVAVMKSFEERIACLQRTYEAFNRRQIDEVLSVLAPEVCWPNVRERRFLQGHRAVREYWEEQFQTIDSHVEPKQFTPCGDRVLVDVRQVVRDLRTHRVGERDVVHVYTFRGDQITRMEAYQTLEEAFAELDRGSA